MHLELPKLPIKGLKDFLKHYLMIVLSILTALGLEAWIEHVHHRHAAETAIAQMDAEIRTNLAEIQKVRAHDAARMHALEKLRDELQHDIQAHVPDAEIIRRFREATPDGFYLDWRWPAMRHEAWDVAVANQSASWIGDGRLHRYSAAYAAQTASSGLMAEDLPMALDGPRMVDAFIDFRGGDIRPAELLHVVNQMGAVANEATHNLEGLIRKINATLSHDAPVFAQVQPAARSGG